LHPLISGNKWRKLKHNLMASNEQQKSILVTKGGNYSNHIYATAAAGKVFNFETIGFIRGEKVDNATLRFAAEQGMKFVFCNRSDYRNINADNFQAYLNDIDCSKTYFLPEGGTNEKALIGTAEIMDEVTRQLPKLDWSQTIVAAAVGTGGTLAGLINGAAGRGNLLGVAVLKGNFLEKEVSLLCNNAFQNWQINNDYHWDGYAKWTPELIAFIQKIEATYQIPLDPIYTSKLFYALFELMQKRVFKEGSTIIALHTGGLQGRIGFTEQYGIQF
jgi:1-aminocyclopropane-1-carboxylate deaminase/D-cysteine desulfhydrase-like pyridoxal-dependent ACC family enzyme